MSESDSPVSPSDSIKVLSKNQQKRLLREKKRQETKAEWRKLQKTKQKERLKARRAECEASGVAPPTKKRVRSDPTKLKTGKIIFDLSFDGIMVNREATSLCSQIMRCYSANRRADLPFNLEISPFSGELAARFQSMYPEHERWDMQFTEKHFKDVYDNSKIIYLTPDTDAVLEDVDPDAVYIIGGIVDKNRFKGKTKEIASILGVRTARLPVPEHIDLKTSPVLTIFHVLEILLKYRECRNWKASLEQFVPQRNMKRPHLDDENEEEEDEFNHTDNRVPGSE